MNCNDIDNLLYDYLTERLNPGERKNMEAHLETCELCRGNLAIMRETLPLLDYWTPPEVSEGFADRVLANISPQKEPLWERVKEKIFFPIHIKLPVHAFAAAAVIFLVVFAYRSAFTPEIDTIPRKLTIETRIISAKAPIIIETPDIDSAFSRLMELVQAHDGRIVRKKPVEVGMQVTLSVQGEKGEGLLYDLSQLGKVSVEKEEYKDSEGNIVIILREG